MTDLLALLAAVYLLGVLTTALVGGLDVTFYRDDPRGIGREARERGARLLLGAWRWPVLLAGLVVRTIAEARSVVADDPHREARP